MTKLINVPAFDIGSIARVKGGSKEGTVRAVRWSSDRNETMYALDTGHSFLTWFPEESLTR